MAKSQYNFDGVDAVDNVAQTISTPAPASQPSNYNFGGVDQVTPPSTLENLGTRTADIFTGMGNTGMKVTKAMGQDASDLGYGAVSGLTMGGKDELGGLMYALMDKAKGLGHDIAPSY